MSGKKDKPINILIIDDDNEYVNDSLQVKARPHRIKLIHEQNLETAKEYLISNKGRYIAGVILDVLCLKTKEQEVPDKSFITEAIKYFETTHPRLPKAVLTGEPDEYRNLKDLYQGTYEIFDKGSGENDLLNYLKAEAKQLEHIKFGSEFPDLFEIFEKEYLEANFLDEIIKCISEMSSSDSVVQKRTLSCIRRIQEEVYITINRKHPAIIPTEFISDGVKCNKIMKHLFENGHTERRGIINQFSWPIYQITSDFGSHSPVQNPKYYISRYTVQALLFSLFDLLLWFKASIEAEP